MNERTASATEIGDIGVKFFSDLAMSATGELFGSLGHGASGDDGRIFQIDPDTGQSVEIGPSGYDALPALDFNSGGILYGIGRDSFDSLVTIDTTTGVATPVAGLLNVAFVDGIVFTDDGRLFGSAFDHARDPQDHAILVEINPVTGLATVIGPMGFDVVAGIEEASDGSLLGSLGGTDNFAGGLVRIDRATGAATLIGLTGFTPVSGLTRNVPPTPLRVERVGGDISLTWKANPCARRYNIYMGTIGSYWSHEIFTASGLDGADSCFEPSNSATFADPGGSVYFLIAADNGFLESNLGSSTVQDPRPFASPACNFSTPTPTHLASVPRGTLIIVDQMASATEIGDIGVRFFSDLALSATGELFGSLGFGAGTDGRIFQIDPDTGQSVEIGPSGYDALPALDFNSGGILYGIGRDSFDSLVTIDTTTGVATPVAGLLNVAFVDGIVFTDDGRLFGSAFDHARDPQDHAILVEINPVTGLATVIGPMGFDVVAGIEEASDGSLLGSLGGTDNFAGGLVRIDRATGAATLIGLTGFTPVSGLTRLP